MMPQILKRGRLDGEPCTDNVQRIRKCDRGYPSDSSAYKAGEWRQVGSGRGFEDMLNVDTKDQYLRTRGVGAPFS